MSRCCTSRRARYSLDGASSCTSLRSSLAIASLAHLAGARLRPRTEARQDNELDRTRSATKSERPLPYGCNTRCTSHRRLHVSVFEVRARRDVGPVVGLAAGLRALGAQVRVCAPPDFAGLGARVGVPVVPVPRPLRPVVRGATPPSTADLPRRGTEFISGATQARWTRQPRHHSIGRSGSVVFDACARGRR